MRPLHKKLGLILSAWTLIWAVTGIYLQWQTITWIPSWDQFKRERIARGDESQARARLLSLGEPGKQALALIPADLSLKRLSKIELPVDGANSQIKLEFLGERTEFLSIDLGDGKGQPKVVRTQSAGPSLIHALHTGQFFGVPGLWIWIGAALGLSLLTLSGIYLLKLNSKSSKSP